MITNFDDYLFEELLNESMINEEFNFNSINNLINKIGDKKEAIFKLIKKFNESTNMSAKKYFATILILLFCSNFAGNNSIWDEYNKSDIVKSASQLSKEKEINIKKIKDLANSIKLDDKFLKHDIISVSSEGLIDKINKIKPKFLHIDDIEQYNQYDDDILAAVKELEEKGETPDANLIKSIMLIETKMNPTKNYKGYEGFPQTKSHIIKSVNRRNHTNFSMKDMYDAKKSAEFIHYYVKGIKRSDYVKTDKDMIIAYNWGLGNLYKYKKGKITLPKESTDYVKMLNVMKTYF
jgi:hypothetical protein